MDVTYRRFLEIQLGMAKDILGDAKELRKLYPEDTDLEMDEIFFTAEIKRIEKELEEES